MGIGDFFALSSEDYIDEISELSDDELRAEEIKEHRKIYGAKYSIGTSAALALHTGGMSLAGAAIGGRRLNVHKRKLEMIQDLMTERNIPLYETTLRDKLIPAVGTAVGLGVGMGVDAGIGAAIAGSDQITDMTVQQLVDVPVYPADGIPYYCPVDYIYTVPVQTGNYMPGAESALIKGGAKKATQSATKRAVEYGLDKTMSKKRSEQFEGLAGNWDENGDEYDDDEENDDDDYNEEDDEEDDEEDEEDEADDGEDEDEDEDDDEEDEYEDSY